MTFQSSDEYLILIHDHKKIKSEIPIWMCAADIEGMKLGEAMQTVSF